MTTSVPLSRAWKTLRGHLDVVERHPRCGTPGTSCRMVARLQGQRARGGVEERRAAEVDGLGLDEQLAALGASPCRWP